jgi:hypothetical protein
VEDDTKLVTDQQKHKNKKTEHKTYNKVKKGEAKPTTVRYEYYAYIK